MHPCGGGGGGQQSYVPVGPTSRLLRGLPECVAAPNETNYGPGRHYPRDPYPGGRGGGGLGEGPPPLRPGGSNTRVPFKAQES